MRSTALLAPRLTARDQTLPPLPIGGQGSALGPSSIGPFSRLFTDIEGWTADGQQRFDRLTAALQWALGLPATTRVYVLGAEFVLAVLLWANATRLIKPVWEAFNSGQWLPLAEAAKLADDLGAQTNMPVLWSTSRLADLGAMTRRIEGWLEQQPRLPVSQTLPPAALTAWIKQNQLVYAMPIAPGGIGGLAWSVAAKGIGLNLSWRGIRVDEGFVRDATLPPEFELTTKQQDSMRRLGEVAASIRPDGRVHPYYSQQAYLRLGAKAPNYQGLSGQPELDERRALLPEPGQVLYSLDVRMAELTLAGIYWARFFGHGKLLDLIAEEGRDIHRESGERLQAKLKRKVPESALRSMGKTLNLALSNLGGAKEIAAALSNYANDTIEESVVQTVLNEIGSQFPYAAWSAYCRDLAFNSSRLTSNAYVQILSGRWLVLQAKQGSRKPSGAAVASALTQGGFADAHAAGLLQVFGDLPPGSVIGTLFDEILLSLPPDQAERLTSLALRSYLKGAQTVTGMPGLRVALRRHGDHWRD